MTVITSFLEDCLGGKEFIFDYVKKDMLEIIQNISFDEYIKAVYEILNKNYINCLATKLI